MTAETNERVNRLKQLSMRMLEDADTCQHFPSQQRLLEAAAELLKKADEIARFSAN